MDVHSSATSAPSRSVWRADPPAATGLKPCFHRAACDSYEDPGAARRGNCMPAYCTSTLEVCERARGSRGERRGRAASRSERRPTAVVSRRREKNAAGVGEAISQHIVRVFVQLESYE